MLATLPTADSVFAQQTVDVAQMSIEAQRVARGLEAQYQAALIRERRLADDRELSLIASYEDRLRMASSRSNQRVAGAEAELERARAEYAQLVEGIALRDASSRVEIEAYRAEARGLAAQATPERLAALQRFADGDRISAWPVLETLRLAEDRALEAMANVRRAIRWREDAELRGIMRLNGEATTMQVLELWERAAILDPSEFWTHINRGRLLLDLGHLREGWDAFTAAHQVATNDVDRATAIVDLGDAAWQGGQWELARRAYSDALGLVRSHANDPSMSTLVAIILDRLSASILSDDAYSVLRMRVFLEIADRRGVRRTRVRELATALPPLQLPQPPVMQSAEQTLLLILQMDEERARYFADNHEVQRALSTALSRLASFYFLTERYAEAEALLRRAIQIDRSIAPLSISGRSDSSSTMLLLGDALAAQERIWEAARLYSEGLEIDRAAHAVDPDNEDKRRSVAISLQRVGAMRFLEHDLRGARRAWHEATAIMRMLAVEAPENASLASDLTVSEALLHLAQEN